MYSEKIADIKFVSIIQCQKKKKKKPLKKKRRKKKKERKKIDLFFSI